MLLATSALVLTLLQQIEEASHAEPPIFQVETLLATAKLLPASGYGEPRREFIDNALRAITGVRDERSRYQFQTAAAHLLLAQAPAEASRLCREIPGRASIPCWSLVDPLEGVRAVAYAEEHSEAEAKFLLEASETLAAADKARAATLLGNLQKAAKKPAAKKAKRIPVSPAIAKKMERVDDDAVGDAERSRLLREVLDVSDSIEDIPERLTHQAAITAWFAGNREEATAALAAVKLHKTFAEACQCEDGQCDSIEGRAECSENIDFFAGYLSEQKIDPAVLRIRHPSLAARALVVKLKESLK
jgi:hypothetical protein